MEQLIEHSYAYDTEHKTAKDKIEQEIEHATEHGCERKARDVGTSPSSHCTDTTFPRTLAVKWLRFEARIMHLRAGGRDAVVTHMHTYTYMNMHTHTHI